MGKKFQWPKISSEVFFLVISSLIEAVQVPLVILLLQNASRVLSYGKRCSRAQPELLPVEWRPTATSVFWSLFEVLVELELHVYESTWEGDWWRHSWFLPIRAYAKKTMYVIGLLVNLSCNTGTSYHIQVNCPTLQLCHILLGWLYFRLI